MIFKCVCEVKGLIFWLTANNVGLSPIHSKFYNLGFLNLTFSYSPQNKNTRLFNYPVRVEEQTLQEWEEMGQEVIPENIGQNV